MNKKGQVVGLAIAVAFLAMFLVLNALISPMKENLDVVRNSTSLNCRGTDDFNQTAYDLDNASTINKLTKRPTCALTGFTMVWFYLAFFIAAVAWVGTNWVKKRRRVR